LRILDISSNSTLDDDVRLHEDYADGIFRKNKKDRGLKRIYFTSNARDVKIFYLENFIDKRRNIKVFCNGTPIQDEYNNEQNYN
jgi:hypothetical protein